MSNSPFKMPGMTFFGPEPVKPQTAKEAAKTGKKRRDLVINAASNWKKKLTTPIKPEEHDDKSLLGSLPTSKKSKTPNIEVGPPVMGMGYE